MGKICQHCAFEAASVDDESKEAESWGQKSRKRYHTTNLESDDDEISSDKSIKKIRTGDKSVVESDADEDDEISCRNYDDDDEDDETSCKNSEENLMEEYISVESDDDDDNDEDDETSCKNSEENLYISVESDDDDEDDETSCKNSEEKFTEERISVVSNDEETSIQNRAENKSRNSLLHSGFSESDAYSQPLIRSVWTGTFNILYDQSIYHRRIHDFNAFVSSKASQELCNVASELEPVIFFEVLPNYSLWPKSFRAGFCPTDDDIAVYFLPKLMKHESVYDTLVLEMIHDDVAMRAFVGGFELLVFTSLELPPRFRKFQGKFYLWGVFRGKNEGFDE